MRHPTALLFAVPNGGFRTWRQGAKLRREGVLPGVTDLILPVVTKVYAGAFLELKQPSNYPSEDQHKFMAAMRRRGYAAGWVNCLEDGLHFLFSYMKGSKLDL